MSFKLGDKVRVKSSVSDPEHAWGDVSPGEVGIVRQVGYSSLVVDFPSQRSWNAVAAEMEVVSDRRKSPEKVLAYGVITKAGELFTAVSDRDKARTIKAQLGGKQEGVSIVVLKVGKEIR